MNRDGKTNHYPAVQFRIARPTDKLQQVIEFYTKGLGLRILYQFQAHDGYSGVMIGLPNAEYHLEFTQDDMGTKCIAPTNDNLLVFYLRLLKNLIFSRINLLF